MIGSGYERVRTRLTLAAQDVDQPLDVHQLRVATRRLLATLDLFRELLPTKSRKRTARQLKRIRRAAGKARDLDVLIQHQLDSATGSKRLIKQLRKKRKRAQKPIARIKRQIDDSVRAAKDLNRLVAATEVIDAGPDRLFADWSREKLRTLVEPFFSRVISCQSSPSQLHKFRIAAKAFRYSLDALEIGFPPRSFNSATRDIRRLQKLLGDVNDSHVAINRYQQIRERDPTFDRKILKGRRQQLEVERRRLLEWWTPEKASSVKEKFERLVD